MLYPADDDSPEGRELRLKQQYFFVACSIARHSAPLREDSTTAWQDSRTSASRDPAQRHPPGGRGRRADARAPRRARASDWDAAWDITQQARHELHQPHPLARGARASGRSPLFERPAAPPPADHLRDQPPLPRGRGPDRSPWPNDAGARPGCRSSRRGPAHAGAHGPPRGRRLAQRQRRGRAALEAGAVERLFRDFAELYPNRFNNKTNGVTPRLVAALQCNPGLAAARSRSASATAGSPTSTSSSRARPLHR